MIATIILNILYAGLSFITTPIRALPDVVLPPELSSSLITSVGYVSGLNKIVPIDLLFYLCVSMLIVVESYIFIFKLVAWAYKKIPGVN